MGDPYPPAEPYDHGMLDVGDGNLVYSMLLTAFGRVVAVEPADAVRGRL